ncbi:MAG TPA: hypothetical protein VD862_02360 [Candidatus Paceibacterota bacterium]|nr:hypothetical protein [Candidatus Paceibacterota bacterium]
MLRQLLGWLARANPSNWFGPGDTRLDRWYKSSGVYKYRAGQRVRIRARNIAGFGVDARGVIVGFLKAGNGDDRYVMDMEHVVGADFFRWMRTGDLPANHERETRRETHFKWNIEHHFVPA